MKKVITVFLIVLTAGILPMSLLAETGYTTQDICSVAKNEAYFDKQNNGCLWQSAGMFLGPIGILLGFIITPPVPPNRLVGKSSDYVITYTNCFNDEIKSNQVWTAVYGCCYGIVLYAIIGIYVAMNTASVVY